MKFRNPRWRWAVILPFVLIGLLGIASTFAWAQADQVAQTTTWLLTQGVLGVATILSLAVAWRFHTLHQKAQDRDKEMMLALLERVLTALNGYDSRLDDNTKAIELILKRAP